VAAEPSEMGERGSKYGHIIQIGNFVFLKKLWIILWKETPEI
jgi:hypothetical protein